MKSKGALISHLRSKHLTLLFCLTAWLFTFLSSDLLHNDIEHLFESGVRHHPCYVCQAHHQTPQTVTPGGGASLSRPLYTRLIDFKPVNQNPKSDTPRFALIPRGPPASSQSPSSYFQRRTLPRLASTSLQNNDSGIPVARIIHEYQQIQPQRTQRRTGMNVMNVIETGSEPGWIGSRISIHRDDAEKLPGNRSLENSRVRSSTRFMNNAG